MSVSAEAAAGVNASKHAAYDYRGRRGKLIAWVILLLLGAFAVFPLFWMVLSSVRPGSELYGTPLRWWPERITFENYLRVLEGTPFKRYVLNSLIVTLTTTVVVTALSAMAGFGLARGRFRFKDVLTQSVLIAYIFPTILIVMPLFAIVSTVGLVGTFPGVIAVHVGFTFPFCTWLMLQYVATIPIEIDEAGRIDGLSNFGAFFRLILPLSGPGLATTATFAFINSWNEFLLSFVILGGGDNRTLPVGMYNLIGSEVAEWGPLMAATAMTILPTLLVFFVAQKQIVGGLTSGSVKS